MSTFLGIDYPTLWFLVVGGLFSGYAILDGFDFGAGAWHLSFKKDKDRRTALNAVGPVWDGNEVWLVIGGGALFAGFPVLYASLFSAMYIPFMLFLMFIIFRAVSIEFRGKEEMRWWRNTWDVAYCISSIMLAFLLGVVLGNVLRGMPLDKNHEYIGGPFFEFLHPYTIVVGITTLALFMTHGAIYLLMKTEGQLYEKLIRLGKFGNIFFIASFCVMSFYTFIISPNIADSFKENPYLLALPLATILSILNVPRLASKKKFKQAFLFSSLTISLLLLLVAIELYPVLLHSTIDPANSITVYNAASSNKSLGIMLTMVAIGAPLVISYTVFVYKTFRGKVKLDETSY
ncbi:cytochrome d ubiquinol oxidase subunit II [Haoranjiania flava]|uniref:Cytochrome d ubiquinol oxidase subunit II n=1 Tax=Haoranjiania flava TaxID=1856322 RepID=A0AAE3IMY8_9BACT|nr:cytochrome d ubiquinol oxidase subunit II [Haoranjiania flava]MCU7693271.1 cytochrome d ubiquinol oxidase subunit II [Haoranjiania flava]